MSVPTHIAIIMDGNGRWAQARGLGRTEGHVAGVEAVRTVLKAAVSERVTWLTLYAFSTENWGRPIDEVNAIMELFCRSVRSEVEELVEEGVRVKIIGSRDGLSEKVLDHINYIEQRTEKCDTITVVFALNYSSHSEITAAVRKLQTATNVDEQTVADALYTRGMPDPDMIIRTGGEQRLSNFLLWQGAYAELYFTDTYFPDFGEEDLHRAIEWYATRERRYGKLGIKSAKQANHRRASHVARRAVGE